MGLIFKKRSKIYLLEFCGESPNLRVSHSKKMKTWIGLMASFLVILVMIYLGFVESIAYGNISDPIISTALLSEDTEGTIKWGAPLNYYFRYSLQRNGQIVSQPGRYVYATIEQVDMVRAEAVETVDDDLRNDHEQSTTNTIAHLQTLTTCDQVTSYVPLVIG
jgi:hypothetical protein